MAKWFNKYASCQKCAIAKFRRNIVIGSGDLPCDILFIGEAPGKSEDLIGQPFVGPSGRILRMAINDVSDKLSHTPSYYITNIVACRPCDRKQGPNREPDYNEIMACRQRLNHIIKLAKAKVVVTLGKVSASNVKSTVNNATNLQHPAYILRRGGVASVEYRLFLRSMTEIWKEIQNHGKSKIRFKTDI